MFYYLVVPSIVAVASVAPLLLLTIRHETRTGRSASPRS